MRVTLKVLAMAGLIAASVLTATSGTAQATAPVFQWHNRGTNSCLDSNSNGNAYTQVCNGRANQRWSQWANSGSYLVKDTATGLFLCEQQGQFGTLCGTPDQSVNWEFILEPGGYYEIKNVYYDYGTGDCLSDQYGQLQAGPCSTNPWTEWWHTS
jgi:hypothetical protein